MWSARALTLFPEMFPGPLGESLAGKALARCRAKGSYLQALSRCAASTSGQAACSVKALRAYKLRLAGIK